MHPQEAYHSAIGASERAGWRIDDVLPAASARDFGRRFLPEALAGADRLDGVLSPRQRLALNHVRAHGYLSPFGIVEEFILPLVVDHARARVDPEGEADPVAARAYLQFAAEGAKHIEPFARTTASMEGEP